MSGTREVPPDEVGDDGDARATAERPAVDDEARRVVLARRARFVAAAVAGVGIACTKSPAPSPEPCLSPPVTVDVDASGMVQDVVEDAAADARPDGGTRAADAGASLGEGEPADAATTGKKADAGSGDGGATAAPSIPPRQPRSPPSPQPMPCLSIALPKAPKQER